MGICFVSITASDDVLDEVYQDPPLIWRLYEPEETELYYSEIGANREPGFLARLLGKRPVAVHDPIPRFSFGGGQRLEIDLDKSWDGINFCLKNILPDDVPNIFEAGREIGNVDVGYGPALGFNSLRVRTMSAVCNSVSEIQLMEGCLPAEMLPGIRYRCRPGSRCGRVRLLLPPRFCPLSVR